MTGSLRIARFWFQLLVTGGFVLLLAWRVDLREALSTLPQANWVWVLPGVAVFTLAKLFHAVRWRIFLGPRRRVPLAGIFGVFLIGNMANGIIPLRAGDLLRIQVASNRFGISRSELTATVIVVETLLDGFTFILLVIIAFVLGQMPGVLRGTFWGMAGLALLGLVLGVVAARWVKPEALEQTYPLRWLSHEVRERVHTIISQFLNGMVALRDPQVAVWAAFYSIPGWLLEAVSYWFFGLAFGLDLNFAAFLIVMMTANFAVSIPLTPSGIGPYEVATQEVVVLLGAERTLATGFAIGTHLTFIVWITLTGLLAMWLMRLTPSEIFTLAREEPETEAQPRQAS